MRIELVGPQAVGKTTIAESVAERLHVPAVKGQGYHAPDGRALSDAEIRNGRLLAIARYPRLFLTTLATYRGVRGARMRFAINTCRRNYVAAQVSDAVFESGPMHGLIQGSVNWETDATVVSRLLVPADLYIRLRAPADVLVDRLVAREGDESLRLTQHEWIAVYERLLDRALAGRTTIEVDTDCPLDEAVARTHAALDAASPADSSA